MHIEPTTRCTLFCPGCPRTWFNEKFNRSLPKHDIALDDLIKFLDCDSGRSIKDFLLCGNHGDPIYHPEILELIKKLRPASVKISTNGSYAKESFWKQLSSLMTENDTVYFSIDGTETTNHLYRRNSDWASIMQGINIMAKSPARIVWKSLIFRYNENQVDEIKKLAEDLGVIFHLEPTSYFGDDNLIPVKMIRHDLTYEHSKDFSVLDPKCVDNQTGYISADGYYWPCCLISSVQTLYSTELWRNRQEWSIQNNTLDSMTDKVNHWAQKVADLGIESPSVCKMHCKKGQKGWVWATI